ncbi:MAG: hypothetical protein F6J93_27810 [Oscillatoria sp. SIO1A7]|nr:hypothetical protein [Oscillatoria sp. SIO1A7]
MEQLSLFSEKTTNAKSRRHSLRVQTSSARTGEGSDDWATPGYVVEAAESFLGGIGLDPFSDGEDSLVPAKRKITKEENGLVQPWGSENLTPQVWLNPPYSMMRPVVKKMRQERERTNEFLLLARNAQGTQWFRNLLPIATCYGVFDHRIKFVGASTQAPFDNVLIYGGGDRIEEFRDCWKEYLGFCAMAFWIGKE